MTADHIVKAISVDVYPDQEPPQLVFQLEFDRLTPNTQVFLLEASRAEDFVRKIKDALTRIPKSG
jgi:hypothetical protein